MKLWILSDMKIPYKVAKTGREKPLLPIILHNPDNKRSYRTFALVDSGSDSCFFDADLGEALGIDIAAGDAGKIYGVVPGKWERQYTHPVIIECMGKSFAIRAGFMRGLSKHGYGILGQSGFFDQVQSVTFEKQKGVFEIIV